MRLIDADDLKEKSYRDEVGISVVTVEAIDNAPTIIWCSKNSDGLPLMDLRPRPQGEWILSDFTGRYYCSVCGNDSLCHLLNETEPYFCSFCGADMRGEKK